MLRWTKNSLLPKDILSLIVEYLNFRDLVIFSRISKLCYRLTSPLIKKKFRRLPMRLISFEERSFLFIGWFPEGTKYQKLPWSIHFEGSHIRIDKLNITSQLLQRDPIRIQDLCFENTAALSHGFSITTPMSTEVKVEVGQLDQTEDRFQCCVPGSGLPERRRNIISRILNREPRPPLARRHQPLEYDMRHMLRHFCVATNCDIPYQKEIQYKNQKTSHRKEKRGNNIPKGKRETKRIREKR